MTLPRLALAITVLQLFAGAVLAPEPQPILLWPHGAPGSEGKTAEEFVRLTEQGEHIVSKVHHPSITPYIPAAATATGAAVIVIPGGGHRELWMDHEGYRVGRWLRDHGIAAFVLKYRLAREEASTYTVEGDALIDVQRAIRLVRSRASAWGVAADRIGVMGFSAGGELAALAGTRHDSGKPGAEDGMLESRSSAPGISPQMLGAIATARPVSVYSVAERERAAQTAPPTLGPSVALTPNSPYGWDDAHLSFWKPSFVLGTSSGGEAGINFWGIHNEGHVNVGFRPAAATSYLLDCRLLSAGDITYKVYGGERETLREHGQVTLIDNHLLLLVTASAPGELISVELWPTPVTETMGFLGCDLSVSGRAS